MLFGNDIKVKALLHEAIFSAASNALPLQRKLQRNNCTCNIPSLQLATQQKIAKQVAEKIEQSSTFHNVAKPVAMCNMSTATRFEM